MDGLHEEVDVLCTLERGVELREAGSYQVLLSSLLQMTQNVPLVEQVLNLFLLCQVVKFDHLECVVAGRSVQRQYRLNARELILRVREAVLTIMNHLLVLLI